MRIAAQLASKEHAYLLTKNKPGHISIIQYDFTQINVFPVQIHVIG